MGLKDAFLQKGWAGKTITRKATVERVNPILQRHIELNHAYRTALARLSENNVAAQLSEHQKTARTDVAKLSETILSAGGRPHTGTDLKPGQSDLGASDDDVLFALRDREQALRDRIAAEKDENHQMRTRAILALVGEHSAERLQDLKEITRPRRRSTSRAPQSAAR